MLFKTIFSELGDTVYGDLTGARRVVKWGKIGLKQLPDDDFTAMNASGTQLPNL